MYKHTDIHYEPEHPMLKMINLSQTEEVEEEENLGFQEVQSGYFGGSYSYEEVNFVNKGWRVKQPDFKKINHSGIIDKGKFSVFSTAVKTAGAKSARSKFKSQAKKVDDFLKDWKKLELAERIVQGLKGNQNMSKADAAEAREALKKVGDLKTIAGRWSKKAKDGKFQENRNLITMEDESGMTVYKHQEEWGELNGPGTLYSNVTSGKAYNRIAKNASPKVKAQIKSNNGTQGLQVLKVGDRFYSYVVLGISPKKTEEDFEFPYTVITN